MSRGIDFRGTLGSVGGPVLNEGHATSEGLTSYEHTTGARVTPQGTSAWQSKVGAGKFSEMYPGSSVDLEAT